MTDAYIRDALDRDRRDAERLAHIRDIVLRAIDALLPLAEALEHPARAWHPGYLIESLREHDTDIRIEQARLTGPVVLE